MTHFSFVGTVFARISHTSPTNAATFVSRGCGGYTHAIPAPNRAHSGLHGETGGVLDEGAIITLGAFCAVRKLCVAGYQNGVLCRFRILVEGNLEERREPAEQRCAHCASLFRDVAAPLGCVIFFASAEIAVCTSCAQAFCVCEAWVVSLPSARFTCC